MAKKQISTYKFIPGNVTPSANLYPNLATLLYENRKYIIAETIEYINYNSTNNIAPFAYYTYDSAKCQRDISYVLEGYISDLKHTGNISTVNNAAKYFEYGLPQIDGNRLPEVYAHSFILDLIINNIAPSVTFTGRQVTFTQYKNNTLTPESAGLTAITTLANVIINVITNGLSSLPAKTTDRGYLKFPGFFKLKDILLITNTTRNEILYNFSDPDTSVNLTYSEQYDSDFPAALYGQEQITTIIFNADTSKYLVTDQIQIFVEGKSQEVRLNSIATDAMERMKVGIPQSMLDADFEYGLQPTKWQTISMMRNYPSVYEIPGSDVPVVSVITDASNGTSGIGSSLITVTTLSTHGLVVGDVFTIKALAASVKGFGRAEGTFLVNSVPTPTSLTYYAKAKVGVTNPTTLSQSYTQLRKAGFYTGASVGTPSFNVVSNGQTGTVATSLVTATGASVFGFTGSPPPLGSPITVSGFPTGTQITAVVGNGGTVAATQLTSDAAIGDTSIVVKDTTGLSPGLIIDRGDGTSVAVTDIQGNTVSLSGALTSVIKGTNATYNNLSPTTTTSTDGSGANFDISRLSTVYAVAAGSSNGSGYKAGDTLLFAGTVLGGTAPANSATITVNTAADKNTVTAFNVGTLYGGTGYSDATAVATSVAPADSALATAGTGLTVDITTVGGVVTAVAINTPGKNYSVTDLITISGGDANATIEVLSVDLGGDIISFSISGTPVTAPTKNFISSIALNDFSTAPIADATTVNYTSIALIEITFATAHGFLPGDSITISINSSGTNAQLAAGGFYIDSTPTLTTLRYTARSQGNIANTLTGTVYARPDSYFVHRPYDGGVQLGTGGPAHGATAIRMSKKYIRYQSGKGVMYNTGALFAPSYDLASLSATGTAVGSNITLATDDTDHGCQVGAQIIINGVSTSGYNGIYTVSAIVDERTLKFAATQTLGSATAVLGSPCQMAVYHWHGATVRSGTFDDQNGMFYQYDGIRMAVVRRSSTFQLAGTINLAANSNAVTGINSRFTQQLAAGDRIVIKGMSHVVSSISSDTALTVTPDYRGVNDVVGGRACKTIDIIVPQNEWNLDPCNGSGPSGYNIDVTKMQMIGMQWTWYGAGFIDFMLRGPDGNYVFAHRFRNSNVNSEAYMRTGNQPVRYEVINEGAKDQLSAAINASVTVIPLTNAYYFPNAGTVLIDNELIRYTGNTGTSLTGCTRGATMTQFVAGSNRTFQGGAAASHSARAGVILASNTVSPIISHWGSAFMIDGQFDSDRGYLFNYSASNISVSIDKNTAFLIRLAPSVSNAQTGDLGDRELLNRAQLLLQNISIASDPVASGGGGIVVEGVLNPANYPTDPTKITWVGLASQATGGQPSFAQVASGGSVTWSGGASTSTATVQGAFTTTLTAKSFAASTQTLTARAFNSTTQSLTAQSFGTLAQAVTALGFNANQPYGNNTYVSALSTARNDILITNAQYDSLTLVPQSGDTITGGSLQAGTTIVSVTRAYAGGAGNTAYTRIVLSAAPASNTTPGTGNNSPLTITTAYSSTYRSAISATRNDFLITTAAYDALTTPFAVGDPIAIATYLTGGQTISSWTRDYVTINGTSYTRVVMNALGTSTSPVAATNGAQNLSLTLTSSVAANYASALSTARSDFLITQADYAALAGNLRITDVLSTATYITTSQTVSSITQNYTTIAGTAYARIVMTAVANSSSAAGASNTVSITSTSAATATYGSAISSGRIDFLVTDAQWTAAGVLAGDTVSAATVLTGSQTIQSFTTGYIIINSTSYTRVVMSSNGNATSTTGGGNDVTVTVTAAGSAASYQNKNFLFFDSISWLASGATVSTRVSSGDTKFPAGTSVSGISTRTFSGTTVYRITFTQTATTTISAAGTITFAFGAQYALPGEQVFSFIAIPGSTVDLSLQDLKELTSTSIGGRGTFPNGPDVLAINVYKTTGSGTVANLVLRWGEAQA
jgi:hypothetical protein